MAYDYALDAFLPILHERYGPRAGEMRDILITYQAVPDELVTSSDKLVVVPLESLLSRNA
ncbi:hypothetical protein [Alicyclobacillus vulcanalis]|uniref:Uncharacterized protein n=1 Tax=Alicyclobacillus vulcanalis TaxID=252246 RepID=A0A1N7L0C8_9BACL|nr:hypothetical protein [Alicyclobacillus vulcanalis]SIS67247.1 hypothetical protein SAMN05421799_102314 [Alicyclobacillus vulcanalis]